LSRHVTVASVSTKPSCSADKDMDKLLDEAAHYAWRARQMGADILAFPEIYPHIDSEKKSADAAEELPGPTTERMMTEARKLGMYIIWPQYTREGDQPHNSAVLINRDGQISGIYHKVHPTIGEIEDGITPGTQMPTFKTDFGTIGMAICYDLNFRDIMTGLKKNGAEIIFFCSAYRGGLQVRAWAFELGCYIVTAIMSDLGQIVDLTGRQLVESYFHNPVIVHNINLNRRLLHMDYNWEKMDKMLEKYGPDLTFDYASPEACYAIGCERAGLDIEQVIDEFGLERRHDYFQRADAVRAGAVAEQTGPSTSHPTDSNG